MHELSASPILKASSTHRAAFDSIRLSTQDIPAAERADWWREMICRHYANVDITSKTDDTFQGETRIVPAANLQLSLIQSSPLSVKKRPVDPERVDQDAYFFVVLLSGQYRLEQQGREACLLPGDMTIYDATRPHKIDCAGEFSKLIVTIPRRTMATVFGEPDTCNALRIASHKGVGAIVSSFLRSWSVNIDHMSSHELATVSQSSLNLLAATLASIRPDGIKRSKQQFITLTRVKSFIEQHLFNSQLDSVMIAKGVNLSPRYINSLFAEENQSLMRYVLERRLDHCHQDIINSRHNGLHISEIAFRWGFNELSHFSRTFKRKYGVSPRDFKHSIR